MAEADPLRLPEPVGLTGTVATIPVTFTGEVPATLLDAYRRAGDAVDLAQPGCHLPMELLAAIGKVETNHARGGRVDSDGTTPHPVLGPVLDGKGFAAIPDTDGGLLDGDTVWDRAVGPMQFLPATWRRWQSDGNGDHRADPNNVYDASLAAGRYLCGNRDLATPQGLDAAILSYNHSASYRNLVLRWMATYTKGTIGMPDDVGGPVPAMLPLPAAPAPPEAEASPAPPAPPTQPAPPPPPTPPPTGTQPPTGEPTRPPTGTQPPTGEPTPPVPVTPSQPPVAPIPPVACDAGGIVTGIVGGLLGPILGTSGLPPCPNVEPAG